MKKILLIGCGHMGNALLTAWIKTDTYNLTIIDPIKYKSLKNKFKNKKVEIIKSVTDLKKNINFDIIIFATKPGDLKDVLNQLCKIKINKKTILASIIAGKKIKTFKKNYKNFKNIFRVMPNMPALINQSMNCVVANKQANRLSINEVLKLFSYSGKTILLESEKYIDMATAISGSGPGFVFNIIDAMESAANKLGFKKEISKILVTETFSGSVNLLLENKLNAKELVSTVATKGGTTESGLKIMKKNNLHKIFEELTRAAYKKAKEQGN